MTERLELKSITSCSTRLDPACSLYLPITNICIRRGASLRITILGQLAHQHLIGTENGQPIAINEARAEYTRSVGST